MKEFNADLHFHSPFAGGVSKYMSVPVIAEQAKLKGLQAVGTADVLSKEWFQQLKKEITEEDNCFRHKEIETYFIVQVELQDMNRVHHVVFLPDFEAALELKEKLKGFGSFDGYGNGRPRIRMNAEMIAENVADAKGFLGPAHAFTPYFGVYAHYDSVQTAYGRMGEQVKFIELGLSADSYFADLIKENHKYNFLTASDSHCVHPETVVYLQDGQVIQIKELHNPQHIISIDFAKNMRINDALPLKITKKPAPEKMHKISIRTKEITVTPEHRFFVLENEQVREKFAFEIVAGELVATLGRLEFGSGCIKLPETNISFYYDLGESALKYLKEKRKALHLAQETVAKKLGMPRDYLWRLESKQYKIRERYLNDLLLIYKIKKQWFLKEFNAKKCPDIVFPIHSDPELCQILGYLLGDGGTEIGRKGRQLGIYDKNKELLSFYAKLFKRKFNVTGKITKRTDAESFRVRYWSAILDFVKSISPQLIGKSKKRVVPPQIFKMSKSELGAFLRGLFDAEGCVGDHSVDICSSNLFLLKQVQSLLLKFGINAYLYKNLFEKTKQKYRHRLFIYGQENLAVFLKNIGFSSNPKKSKLKLYLKSLKSKPKDSFVDYLPLTNLVEEILKLLSEKKSVLPKTMHGFFWKTNRKIRKRHIKEIISVLEDKVNLCKDKDIVEKFEKLKMFANSDISWQQVQKNEIVKSDCKYVFDLTVPGFENYVAEGIIVHNSPWPHRIGREFIRVKAKKPNFEELKKVFERKEEREIVLNVGLNPKEGKYHETACSSCYAHYSLEQAERFGMRCPKCKASIKRGVKERIMQLASFSEETHPSFRPAYKHLLPLAEIIQLSCNAQNVQSDNVQEKWKALVKEFGNEINVLLDVQIDEMGKTDEKTARAVDAFRKGFVVYKPGGGGQYGQPFVCYSEKEAEAKKKQIEKELRQEGIQQKSLFEY